MGERLKIGNVLFVGILGSEAVAQKAAFLRKQSELFAVVFRLFVPLLFDAFPFRNGAHERFGDLPALPLENGEAGTETAVVLTDLFGNFTLALQDAVILLFEALNERAHFLCGIHFEHFRLPCRSGASFPSSGNAARAISRLYRYAAYRGGCTPPRSAHTPN